MSGKVILGLLAASLLAWGPTGARAALMDGGVSVLNSQSVLMQQSGANTTTLAIPGAGELLVTVTDLQFPTSFASLQYAVSNAAGTVIPLTTVKSTAGVTTSLDLTAPTTLYANVFATLGSSAGLYNLTATFVSAVPLPGSIVLFSGGALLLLLFRVCSANLATTRGSADEDTAAATPA